MIEYVLQGPNSENVQPSSLLVQLSVGTLQVHNGRGISPTDIEHLNTAGAFGGLLGDLSTQSIEDGMF